MQFINHKKLQWQWYKTVRKILTCSCNLTPLTWHADRTGTLYIDCGLYLVSSLAGEDVDYNKASKLQYFVWLFFFLLEFVYRMKDITLID